MTDAPTLFLIMSSQVVAAGVIRQVIEVLKAVAPNLPGDGRQQALAISGVLYVFGFLAVGTYTIEGGFAAFMAWLGCLTSIIGINSALTPRAPLGTTTTVTPATVTVKRTEVDAPTSTTTTTAPTEGKG